VSDGRTRTDNLAESSLDGDERWELVKRIAATPSFRKSPRLKQFLFFITERSLSGHPEETTEYNIGWKVFERKADLDDSIVRTTARHLRTKIKEYFESEGSDEAWILEIPKGAYVPIFRKKEDETPKVPSGIGRWQLVAAGLSCIAVSLFAGYFLGRTAQGTSHGRTIVSTVLQRSQQPTRVVVGDYGAILMSTVTRRPYSVEEYANQTYAREVPREGSDVTLQRLWNQFGLGQLVPLSDVTVVASLLRSSRGEENTVAIQHARQLTARDLRSGNFILLHTPLGNPWLTLFSDKLNFKYRVTYNPLQQVEFINTHPLPGEKLTYQAAPTTPGFGVAYGLVARVPNLTGTGKVLLVSGLRFAGGEAAGDYATDPKAATELAKLFKVKDISEVPDFEVLLETYSIAAAPRSVKVIAFRRVQ
jgi:hypothetical protein